MSGDATDVALDDTVASVPGAAAGAAPCDAAAAFDDTVTSAPGGGAVPGVEPGMVFDDTIASDSPTQDELRGGARVGRMIVLGKVGAGGMGVVYAAHDPELNRRVALKLIKHRARRDSATTRFLREAQALARLTHPNIVTVFDVGVHEESTWIAMEFVEGETFARWCEASQRHWREVLSVILDAARGVEAAHNAGILHRDLKPDNIMIGTDGRVRVMDFGLARTTDYEEGPRSLPIAHESQDMLTLRLTNDGAIMGTPAYMAPEQFRGAATDERTDQFALCVSCWEGLFGQRPFAGTSFAELKRAVVTGERSTTPTDVHVPRWVHRVLERGLSVDSAQRYPTTRQFIEALEADPTRRRRRRWLLASTTALAFALAGAWRLQRARVIAACETDANARVAAAWGDEAREATRLGLQSSGARFADVAAERVTPWLDRYAETWREHHTQICLDAAIHGRLDGDALTRARWCLDEREQEFVALVRGFARADEETVQLAVDAAANLPAVAPCAELEVLNNLPPPPPDDVRAAIAGARASLARANALNSSGKYRDALTIIDATIERAEALGWPPFTARARLRRGIALAEVGEFDNASAVLAQAFTEATEARAWADAAAAADHAALVDGYHRGHYESAMIWIRSADAAALNASDPLGLRRADRLETLAELEVEVGHFEQARPLYQEALELYSEVYGPRHPRVSRALLGVGNVEKASGRYDEAMASYRRALEIDSETLGDKHPHVAIVLNNMAVTHLRRGELEKARALLEEVHAIRVAALGERHPHVARSHLNLAAVLYQQDELAAAARHLEEALALFEETVGPDHQHVAVALSNLARVKSEMGQLAEAASISARAVALLELVKGPNHDDVAGALENLATIYERQNNPQQRGALERALEIRLEALGEGHPKTALTRLSLGELALEERRLEDAYTLLEAATTTLAKGSADPNYLASARFALARALEALGREPARARQLARQALESYRGADMNERRAGVEAWLAGVDRSSSAGGETR